MWSEGRTVCGVSCVWWLYGEQGGYCLGCGEHFQARHLTIDHIIPRAKGGTDHISNLQHDQGHENAGRTDCGADGQGVYQAAAGGVIVSMDIILPFLILIVLAFLFVGLWAIYQLIRFIFGP